MNSVKQFICEIGDNGSTDPFNEPFKGAFDVGKLPNYAAKDAAFNKVTLENCLADAVWGMASPSAGLHIPMVRLLRLSRDGTGTDTGLVLELKDGRKFRVAISQVQ